MSNIEIGADDVIELENHKIGELTLFTGLLLLNTLRAVGGPQMTLVSLNPKDVIFRCRFLSPGYETWKKGRIRLSMEFIPDEPEPQKEEPLNEWEQPGR